MQHKAAKVNKNNLEKSRDDSAARSRESYLKDPEKSQARNCESYMKDRKRVMLTVQHDSFPVIGTLNQFQVLHYLSKLGGVKVVKVQQKNTKVIVYSVYT